MAILKGFDEDSTSKSLDKIISPNDQISEEIKSNSLDDLKTPNEEKIVESQIKPLEQIKPVNTESVAEVSNSVSNKLKTKDNIEIEQFIEAFIKSYKDSERKTQIIRLEKSNVKKLAKLKGEGISISLFINLAISFMTNSDQYNKIVKQLKKE